MAMFAPQQKFMQRSAVPIMGTADLCMNFCCGANMAIETAGTMSATCWLPNA